MKKSPLVAGKAIPVYLAAPVSAGDSQRNSRIFFSDDNEVNARRRRQGTGTGPQAGRRAEAPQRRREGAQGGAPSGPTGGGTSGGGGYTSGGGGLSGGGGGGSLLPTLLGGKKIPIWLILLLIVGFFICQLLGGGGGLLGGDTGSDTGQDAAYQETLLAEQFAQPQEQPGEEEAPVVQQPTRTPAPTRTRAPATGEGKKWTVMLYQDADDQVLEKDIFVDLNEVERVGSSDEVNIVTQIDRYRGAFSGDGNWQGTRRYYVTQDDDLTSVGSDLVQDLGEANMASGNTLVDFIQWAVENYPAQKYALVLSDHGTGWPGGWSDPDPGGKQPSRIPIVSAIDDNLFLNELDAALKEAQQRTGIDQFELIGMDACLMGHIEVYAALQPYARFAVTSQETEPSLGWAYASFINDLVRDPDMDGAALGAKIVDSYIRDDQRIVDNEARSDFLNQGNPMTSLFGGTGTVSAAQLAQQLSRGITIAAVDLSQLPALMESVNTMAVQLQDEDQSVVASARTYAQSFTNIFGKSGPAPYIDLGSFVSILRREGSDQQALAAGQQVLAAIQSLVIAEKHGSGKAGATGVSIYFPNSTLYSSPVAGPQSYTGVADRFAQESLWDDFLAYHYHNRPIRASERVAAVPDASMPSRAPGLGTINVGPVQASSTTAAPGRPVTLRTQINGDNIGYIYLFVGYYDQTSNSIWVADTDYLESDETRQEGGVYYPVWSENSSFTLRLDWDPTVFEISDGATTATALFTPQSYGVSAEQAVYTVDGTFTYAADGQSRRARLYFQDGRLQSVVGFTSQDAAGAPREIIPQRGDTFVVQEKWFDLDSSGRVTGTAFQDGTVTLTFGGEFTLQEVYAPAGQYIVGFIVEDMDGNNQQVFTQVTVQ